MTYAAPDAFDFKTRFRPAFDDVPDSVVADVLMEVGVSHDEAWPDAERRTAVMLHAAHVLTVEKMSARFPGVKRVKDGSIELEREASAGDGLKATSYGQRLLGMISGRTLGPIVV